MFNVYCFARFIRVLPVALAGIPARRRYVLGTKMISEVHSLKLINSSFFLLQSFHSKKIFEKNFTRTISFGRPFKLRLREREREREKKKESEGKKEGNKENERKKVIDLAS